MRRASTRVALSVWVMVLAVVVAGAGAMYVSGRRSFRRFTDRELDGRAAEVEDYLRTSGAGPMQLVADASRPEQFTQLLDDGGAVVSTSSMAASHAPVVPAADASGPESAVIYRTRRVEGVTGRARLRVSHLRSGDRTFVLVVGANLDEHDRSQRHRLLLFAVAGLVAAAVAALLAGYLTRRSFAGARWLALRLDSLPDDTESIPAEVPTEWRDLAEHLDALAARVTASSARERVFVAAAAHDLSSYAVHVLYEIELLTMTNQRQVPASALAQPREAASTLIDYIGAMLDLERLRAAPADEQVPIDLHVLADQIATEVAATDDATIMVVGSANAHADPIDVERALRNLIANAARHAREHVAVTLSESSSTAQVEIHDDGPGFPNAVLEAIDDALPNYGKHRVANGLGLRIARTSLQRNNATLTITNHPQGGGLATATLERASGPEGRRQARCGLHLRSGAA